jgi:hypothetical protein
LEQAQKSGWIINQLIGSQHHLLFIIRSPTAIYRQHKYEPYISRVSECSYIVLNQLQVQTRRHEYCCVFRILTYKFHNQRNSVLLQYYQCVSVEIHVALVGDFTVGTVYHCSQGNWHRTDSFRSQSGKLFCQPLPLRIDKSRFSVNST